MNIQAYIKLSTLEYPRFEGDIRLEHRNILESQTGNTFPCPETYAPVYCTECPSFDKDTQFIVEGTPINNNGIWETNWILKNYNSQQLALIAAEKSNTANSIISS